MAASFGQTLRPLTQLKSRKLGSFTYRAYATMAQKRRGLVLGVYVEDKTQFSLTNAAKSLDEEKSQQLTNLVKLSGLADEKGKSRVFYGLDDNYDSIAVVSLGKRDQGYNELEEVDEGRERIRAALAGGVRQLREAGVKSISVDPCGDAEAAAEGCHLSLFSYDELKAEDKRKSPVDLECYLQDKGLQEDWKRGVILSQCQNVSRRLMEAPANVMTPTQFAEQAKEEFSKLDKCEVRIRDRAWAESMKMGSFLSVSNGSDEPLKFVEIEYRGGKEGEQPLALVGKGITFDSGGISIKPSPNMDAMRADMGGAACVFGSTLAIAKLKLPINVIALMPLCENMPSGKATKPGDVVRAMNGKTIQVDNTDAEGRLILADALCYAATFNPSITVDMATLTGAVVVALGSAAAGVFTNSAEVWQALHKAGTKSGDRVWRMPLFKHYSKQMTECHLADINNIGGGRMGGSCTAAAFLREFVTMEKWAHIDIAGVMDNKDEVPYLGKGMAGRPVRTIAEFAKLLSQKNS